MAGLDLSHSMAAAHQASGTAHLSGGGNAHNSVVTGTGTFHVPNSHVDVSGGGTIVNHGGHMVGGGTAAITGHLNDHVSITGGGFGNSAGGGGVFGGISAKW